MNETTKFCKDCAHCVAPLAHPYSWSCSALSYTKTSVDPVTGPWKERFIVGCEEERQKGLLCGPDGELFEQRPPTPKRTRWQRFFDLLLMDTL